MKRRIVIGNEVKLTLELESSFLQREGFTVNSAGNGREALEMARKVKPDLVLIDYDMPLLTGVEVCQAIRADEALSGLPVLMVSDRDDAGVRERCRKAGCSGFVSRTEGAEGLLKAVAAALQVGVRGRARVPVKLQVQAGAHYQNFRAEARDLSLGGMRLECPEPIDVGLPVVVQFKLPSLKHGIIATVKVTRCSPSEDGGFLIAASFETLDDDSRGKIERFLKESEVPAIALQRKS